MTLVIPAFQSLAVPLSDTVMLVRVSVEKFPSGAPSKSSIFKGARADAAASNAAAAASALGLDEPGPAPGSIAEYWVIANTGVRSPRSVSGPTGAVLSQAVTAKAVTITAARNREALFIPPVEAGCVLPLGARRR